MIVGFADDIFLKVTDETLKEVKILTKRVLKYLSVMIDDRLNFNSPVDYASEKAPSTR